MFFSLANFFNELERLKSKTENMIEGKSEAQIPNQILNLNDQIDLGIRILSLI